MRLTGLRLGFPFLAFTLKVRQFLSKANTSLNHKHKDYLLLSVFAAKTELFRINTIFSATKQTPPRQPFTKRTSKLQTSKLF